MAVLQEFKCPNCKGSITFDSDTQKMKCPYCDAHFDVPSLRTWLRDKQESGQDDINWESVSVGWQEGELEGLRVYVCQSCGGEILTDENTVATACPFCDNPVVVKKLVAGDLKPDLVIPFKFDKEAAKAALREHYAGKSLLPGVFKKENHIDEIRGIYVPFWFFDADTHTRCTYHATKVENWSDLVYYYTRTKHYHVVKAGTMQFRNVPVDGSSKLDDRLMESIEPFDVTDAVTFETAYLSGYLADKYDVDTKKSMLRANARIKSSAMDAIQSRLPGFQSAQQESAVVQLNNTRCKYVLCPVWLLHTTWRGNRYTFAMNGQTGKLVGDLPRDYWAMARMFFGVAAMAGAAFFGLCYLVWMML